MGYSELRAYYRIQEQIGSIRHIPSAEYQAAVRLLEDGTLESSAGCADGHALCDGLCAPAQARRERAQQLETERQQRQQRLARA